MRPARMASSWVKICPWYWDRCRSQPTRAEDLRRAIEADEPSLDEVLAARGARRATPEEFDTLFGDLPGDDAA